MKTLAILSRKGGVGKTTVTLHAAVAAQAAGLRTLIVDMDPQRSSLDWWKTRDASSPELVEAEPGSLATVKRAASEDGVELMVIDTRPSAEGDALEAARAADLALIVVRPSILDLRAAAGTVEVVERAGTPGMILLNQAPSKRGVAEAPIVMEAREALTAYGLPVCPVVLRSRSAYHAALIDGRAVNELEPTGKATDEIAALWRVLKGKLHGPV